MKRTFVFAVVLLLVTSQTLVADELTPTGRFPSITTDGDIVEWLVLDPPIDTTNTLEESMQHDYLRDWGGERYIEPSDGDTFVSPVEGQEVKITWRRVNFLDLADKGIIPENNWKEKCFDWPDWIDWSSWFGWLPWWEFKDRDNFVQYVVTWAKWDSDTNVTFTISSDDADKTWVDGKPMEDPYSCDVDAGKWVRITAKVREMEGSCGYNLRTNPPPDAVLANPAPPDAYIVEWLVLDPPITKDLEQPMQNDYLRNWGGERYIEPCDGDTFKEQGVVWRKVNFLDLENNWPKGCLNWDARWGSKISRGKSVEYLVTWAMWSKSSQVTFYMSSDDTHKTWADGELINQYLGQPRGWSKDQESGIRDVPAGRWVRITAKVYNEGGPFAYTLRADPPPSAVSADPAPPNCVIPRRFYFGPVYLPSVCDESVYPENEFVTIRNDPADNRPTKTLKFDINNTGTVFKALNISPGGLFTFFIPYGEEKEIEFDFSELEWKRGNLPGKKEDGEYSETIIIETSEVSTNPKETDNSIELFVSVLSPSKLEYDDGHVHVALGGTAEFKVKYTKCYRDEQVQELQYQLVKQGMSSSISAQQGGGLVVDWTTIEEGDIEEGGFEETEDGYLVFNILFPEGIKLSESGHNLKVRMVNTLGFSTNHCDIPIMIWERPGEPQVVDEEDVDWYERGGYFFGEKEKEVRLRAEVPKDKLHGNEIVKYNWSVVRKNEEGEVEEEISLQPEPGTTASFIFNDSNTMTMISSDENIWLQCIAQSEYGIESEPAYFVLKLYEEVQVDAGGPYEGIPGRPVELQASVINLHRFDYDRVNYRWRVSTEPGLRFEGGSIRVESFPISDLKEGRQMTAAFWMKPLNTRTDDMLLSFREDNDFSNWKYFCIQGPDELKVGIRKHPRQDTGVSPSLGQWHHIAVTWRSEEYELDGKPWVADHVKFYMDGREVWKYDDTWPGSEPPQVDNDLVIGQDFNGYLDDVSIWRKALNQEDIVKLMAGTLEDPPNLAGLWSLDNLETIETQDGKEIITRDRSSLRNDGKIEGGIRTSLPAFCDVSILAELNDEQLPEELRSSVLHSIENPVVEIVETSKRWTVWDLENPGVKYSIILSTGKYQCFYTVEIWIEAGSEGRVSCSWPTTRDAEYLAECVAEIYTETEEGIVLTGEDTTMIAIRAGSPIARIGGPYRGGIAGGDFSPIQFVGNGPEQWELDTEGTSVKIDKWEWAFDKTLKHNQGLAFIRGVYVNAQSLDPAVIDEKLSVSAWVKADKGRGGTVMSAEGGFQLGIEPGGNQGFAFFSIDIDPESYKVLSKFPVDDNIWHHIVGVYNGSHISLYVDGIPQNGVPVEGDLMISGSVLIGEDFVGCIDEVTVWSEAIVQWQVDALKRGKLPENTTGILGYWPFNEAEKGFERQTLNVVAELKDDIVTPGSIDMGELWVKSEIDYEFDWAPAVVYERPGEYKARLQVRANTGRWSVTKETTVTVLDGSIWGTVRAADLRTPVAEAQLKLTSPSVLYGDLSDLAKPSNGWVATDDGGIYVETDEEGMYQFQCLPLGIYRIEASKVERTRENDGTIREFHHKFQTSVKALELTLSMTDQPAVDFVDLSVFPVGGTITAEPHDLELGILYKEQIYVSGVVVEAIPLGTANTIKSTPSDPDKDDTGRNYTLPLFGGKYVFSAQAEGHDIALDPDVPHEPINQEKGSAEMKAWIITVTGATNEIGFIDSTERTLKVLVQDPGGFPVRFLLDKSIAMVVSTDMGEAGKPVKSEQDGSTIITFKLPPGEYTLKATSDFEDEGFLFRDPHNPDELVSSVSMDLKGEDGEATMVIPVPIDIQFGPRPRLFAAPLSEEGKEALAELLGVEPGAIDDLENLEGYMFYWPPAPQQHTYAIRATANDKPVEDYTAFVTDNVSLMAAGTATEQRISVSSVLTVEKDYEEYVTELEGLEDWDKLPSKVKKLFADKGKVNLSEDTYVRKAGLPDLEKGWIITDRASGKSYFLRIETDKTLYVDDGAYTVLGGLPHFQELEGGTKAALLGKSVEFYASKEGYRDSEIKSGEVRVLGDRKAGAEPELIATPNVNYLVLHDPPGDGSYAYFDDSLTIKGAISEMTLRAEDGTSVPVYPSPREDGNGIIGPEDYKKVSRVFGQAAAAEAVEGAVCVVAASLLFGPTGFTLQIVKWGLNAYSMPKDEGPWATTFGAMPMIQYSVRPHRRLETPSGDELPDLLGPGRGDIYFGEGLTIGLQHKWRFGLEYVNGKWKEKVTDPWTYDILQDRSNQYIYTTRDIESVIEKLDNEGKDENLSGSDKGRITGWREDWIELLEKNPAYVWSEFYVGNEAKLSKLKQKEELDSLEEFYLEQLEDAKAKIKEAEEQDKDVFEAFREAKGLPEDSSDEVETFIFSGGPAFEYSRTISQDSVVRFSTDAAVATSASTQGQLQTGPQMPNPFGLNPVKWQNTWNIGVSLSFTTTQSIGRGIESGQEVEQTVGFVLQDDEVGDNIATRVYTDTTWGTPLFVHDMGSVTSDPWEPGTNRGIDVTLELVPSKLDLLFTVDFNEFTDAQKAEIIDNLDGRTDEGKPTFPTSLAQEPEFEEHNILEPTSVEIYEAGSRWMFRDSEGRRYALRLEPDAYGVDKLNIYKVVVDEEPFDYHAGAHYKVRVMYTGKRNLESDFTTFDFMLYAPQTDNKDNVTVRFNEQNGTYLSYKVGLTKEAPTAYVAVSVYPPKADMGNWYEKEYPVIIVAQEIADAQIISEPWLELKPRFADLRVPRATITSPYSGQRLGPMMFEDGLFKIEVVTEDTDIEKILLEHRAKGTDGNWGSWGQLTGVELKDVQELRKEPPYFRYIFEWSEKPGTGEHQLKATAFDKARHKWAPEGNKDMDPPVVDFTMDEGAPEVLTSIPDYQLRDSERIYRGELSVIFTEDMRSGDFSPGKAGGEGTFDVLNLLTGKRETGYVSYSPALRKAVFVPEIPLESNGFYKVTIRKGVRDLAGNPMKRDFSWTFRTTDLPSEQTWHIVLSATDGTTTDTNNIAGIAHGAGDGEDTMDARAVPGIDVAGALRLSFLDGDRNDFDRDFRPADGRLSYHWFFVVENAGAPDVTLRLHPSVELTDPLCAYGFIELVMFDADGNPTQVIPIDPGQGDAEYLYPVSGDETYFRLDVMKARLVAAEFQAGPSGWKFLSVPIDPQRSDPFVNLGDDIDPFQLYQYDTGSGGYKVYPLDVGEVGLDPGYGYFTRLNADVEVDVGGSFIEDDFEFSDSEDADAPPFGPAGWYAIGNPFFAPVNVGNLELNGMDFANAGDLVESTLYRWRVDPASPDGDGYEQVVFDPDNPDAATLEPWEGYWIKTRVDGVRLTIPVPDNLPDEPGLPGSFDPPMAAPAMVNAQRPKTDVPGRFDLKLALTSSFASDMITSLGTSARAKPGLDTLDTSEPPTLSQTVAVYFDHPEWGGLYNTDYQPLLKVGDTRTWRFVAFTDRRNAKMTLSWASSMGSMPDDIFLSFRREDEGEWKDMRDVQSVELASESRVTRIPFEVRAERFAMAPPADVQVLAGEAQVQIRWKAEDSSFIEAYSISRRMANDEQPTVFTLRPDVHQYVDTDVEEEQTYTYQISVCFITGAELHSDLFSVTVLPVIKETVLLQNYPNPFNPETWIPYELAEDADVFVEIYTVAGQLVRRLDLGSQKRGRYTAQKKAAHWDGCNEAGEMVASGAYFYVLRAGKCSATRKMVIFR